MRFGALAFIAVASAFMTVIMLGASMLPAYDYDAAAISDLGVTAQTATLFNVTLIAVGLGNILGGFVFYGRHERPWLLALFAIAGVGAVGAGIFPLSTGGLHGISALVAFLFFNLEAVGTAAVVRGPMRWLSIVAGLTGICFVVLMLIGDSGDAAAFGAIGHGGTERMIVYPVMLWMLALGGYLLGRTDSRTRAE